MAEVIFIETLDTHGKVLERHRVQTWPVTIGRDYKNSIILDDPTVSLLHLSIQNDETGNLCVLDCKSENGTWHQGRKIETTPVGNEIILRLGETEIRVRTDDTVLRSTVPIDPARLHRPCLNRKFIFFLLFALSVGEAAFDGYWNSFAPKALPDILLTLAPIFVGLPLWAGIWGLVGRTFTGRALFFAHGSIGAIAFLSTMLAIKLKHFVAFAFNAPDLAKWLDLGLYGLGIGLTSYFHLRLASKLNAKIVKQLCIGLMLLFWTCWLLGEYAFGLNGDDTLNVDTTLLPPAARLTPEMSLEEFFKDSESLGTDLPANENFSNNNTPLDTTADIEPAPVQLKTAP